MHFIAYSSASKIVHLYRLLQDFPSVLMQAPKIIENYGDRHGIAFSTPLAVQFRTIFDCSQQQPQRQNSAH
jgi:hypothetical protein